MRTVGAALPAAAIEPAKWCGLAAMLLEHGLRYGMGVVPGWAYAVGRLAFPLFTIALALGLRARPFARLPALIGRLVGWALVAEIAVRLVDAPPGQVNVLFTFALGVAAAWLLESGRPLLLQALGLATIGFVSIPCEFGPWGVAWVTGAVRLARAGDRPLAAWLAVVALLIALAVPNGNGYAVLAIPVAVSLTCARLRMPRIRGLFYWTYTLQFPALAGLRWAMTGA